MVSWEKERNTADEKCLSIKVNCRNLSENTRLGIILHVPVTSLTLCVFMKKKVTCHFSYFMKEESQNPRHVTHGADHVTLGADHVTHGVDHVTHES